MSSKSEGCVRFLTCPVCGAGLAEANGALTCPRAHSFDVAREGYVNLLLAARRRPKIQGDTREMLRARRDFLDRGFYEPLSDAINERVCGHLVGASSACIADVGCGEGYYVGRLKHYLDGRQACGDTCYFGLDVSKEAARLAARRHKGIRFIVADVNQRVLLSDGSVRVLLNVFAPRNRAEFARVVAQNGRLLIVIPSPGHLASLRSKLGLLSIEADKRERVVEQFTQSFELAREDAIEYEMHLDGEALADLIRMTPNYWHVADEAWSVAQAAESVRTRASFTILEFRR